MRTPPSPTARPPSPWSVLSRAPAQLRALLHPPTHPSDRMATHRHTFAHLFRHGGMLFVGFGAAQACSFIRNALIGHALSRGDFGIAASITLTLQLCETLLDIGADRLIIQARDGNRPRLMAVAHTVLLARGIVTALLLYALAAPITALFHIPSARPAFEAIALVPLLKGFMHLDMRRSQRTLDNLPYLYVEVLPQLVGLIATLPLLWVMPSYEVVIIIAVLQALATVATSHGVATRSYRLDIKPHLLKRFWIFGWPIWLSALPLTMVFQGDRILVGNLLGMDALANYSVVFMVTMVPGLIAAKAGNALMLPMLSATKLTPDTFTRTTNWLLSLTALAALAYLGCFAVVGDFIITLTFGAKYAGLSALIAALATMWAIRMVQSVPGMALMAIGETKPLLIAGLIRACALALAYIALVAGYGLVGAALSGALGELASLVYIARTARKQCPFTGPFRFHVARNPGYAAT